MKVFIVEGEHPHVGGKQMSVHETRVGANKAASDMINIILKDIRHNSKPRPTTADDWQNAASWLDNDWAGDPCYVSCNEYEVKL